MGESRLISLEEALAWDQPTTREYYKKYVNPGLAQALRMVNLDRPFVRAEGVRVWDADGTEYLDFLGAFGAVNLGHNPPEVLDALQAASSRPNLLQITLNPLAAALAHNLSRLAPGTLERTFFCNSGAEAVEGALKLAKAATGRSRLISCEGSFHGKTTGALSVTGREKYRAPFQPLLPGCELVPFGDLDALERALEPGDVAAFIVEPIQGEGGIVVPPDGYMKEAQALCRAKGTLLIVDEIQTGFGRTGSLFASEAEGVEPDILCLAKSLGGGVVPIGAFLTRAELWDRVYGGIEGGQIHTSTFGGNARATAAALKTLEIMERDGIAARTKELGDYFRERLEQLQQRHPLLVDVRGRGLMVGLEFAKAEGWADRLTGGNLSKTMESYLGAMVAGELMNRHQIITAYTLNNPNVIRMEPPLVVTREQLDKVVDALDDTFSRSGSAWKMALATGKNLMGGLLTKRQSV